jgi:hypothetical protein
LGQIERAEYWIAPGRVSYLFAAARAAVTGIPAAVIGENRKLCLASSARIDKPIRPDRWVSIIGNAPRLD